MNLEDRPHLPQFCCRFRQPNGRTHLAITDSYYDKQKKCSRSKTIESIGYLDELEKIYDDPIAHFTKRVEQLREEKKIRNAPINFTFYHSDKLCVGDNLRKNFGYTALSKIYHELEINKFLNNKQRHTKEEYDANTIVQMGLFMDSNAIPITYELFPGNTNDCLTYRPNFGRIKKQFDLGRVISVADKAMTTGEIFTASSVQEIGENIIREEEKFDGYYVLLTSEMEESDDKIIDLYRGLWKIEESFKITKSELEARPVFVWTKEHIEAHFLTCFVALTIVRILEHKLDGKYCAFKILESLSKSECSLLQQNYYAFDYYDEILKDIGKITGIDFSKRIQSLGDIKKCLAETKK